MSSFIRSIFTGLVLSGEVGTYPTKTVSAPSFLMRVYTAPSHQEVALGCSNSCTTFPL